MTASMHGDATTDRTRLRIHPERAAPDELGEILYAGLVAHVAIADDAGPVVIPMTYHVDAEAPTTIYIHGAHHSRLMAHVASGKPVCASVTLVYGLVYSRTALYHSVNYRSAVCFGIARVVEDGDEQRRVSNGLIARYFPARTAGIDFDPIPAEHLSATSFVAIDIVEASAKCRRGGPKGPRDQDPDAPGSAGVVHFDPPR
jgi:nitroimidazol reductase NimA-like FMN-containing flavoprotein (pyridoxamine 5'-phosphate oxidase superfamily)